MQTNVPRYTSYPPVPFWDELPDYSQALRAFSMTKRPLSLYIHIPFCKKRCLFCGCHVVLNRKEEVATQYVQTVNKEATLLASHLPANYPVHALHLGGGTPTHLTKGQLDDLLNHLFLTFSFTKKATLSIELDCRTLNETTLPYLKRRGFHRLSFGIQDTNEKVQRAVNRNQSLETTRHYYKQARGLDFPSICLELIYGLPFQTEESFSATVENIRTLRPDRIALYSFARIPWLKPHQNAIREEDIPDPELKLALYVQARKQLIDAGYQTIGMDHFALPDDPLAFAHIRSFQGYTTPEMEHLVGLGISSIGFIDNTYFQNIKDVNHYKSKVDSETLPIFRGKKLSKEDFLRKWTIHTLMCHNAIDKKEFAKKFGTSFDLHFKHELILLSDEFVENNDNTFVVTEKGRLFIRTIASHFDSYYPQGNKKQFSNSI